MQAPEAAYVYRGTITKISDGDTCVIRADLGFHIQVNLTLRLFGIDTPEKGKPGNKEATARVKELARVGTPVTVQTFEPPENGTGEKWGRWLAFVWLPDGRCLNDVLLQERLAVPYDGGTKTLT